MENRKRAWIYTRIAAKDDPAGALAIQEQALRDCAKTHGFDIAGASSDCTSGRSAERPGLQRMLEAAKAGRFDTLIIMNSSRLARDMALMYQLETELAGCGVTVYAALENGAATPGMQETMKDLHETFHTYCKTEAEVGTVPEAESSEEKFYGPNLGQMGV